MASVYPIAGQQARFEPDPPEGADPELNERRLQEQLSEIAQRLQSLADEQVRKKGPTEQRVLEDLRNFHGRYDPGVEADLKEAEKSRAFVKITRKKANSWEARLQSLLFPTDEENWSIQATPLPSLTQEAQQAMQQAQATLDQANAMQQQQDPNAPAMAEQAQQQFSAAGNIDAEIAEAKKRSEAMFMEMKDQLKECDYASECRMVIRDGVRLGTGIIKGPLASDSQRGQWVVLEDGTAEYQRGNDPAPRFRWVDWWSYFPDMNAIRAEDREFEFERHLWSAKDLRRLVRERAFSRLAVKELLDDNRQGRAVTDTSLGYLTNLRGITGSSEAITGRYVGWEYHGPLETREVAIILRGLGQAEAATRYETDNDPLQEVRVIVFFCEGKVLKISPCYPLDSQESLYSLFTFEPSEASIFGYGIPHIMSDSQAAMNGAWRMALDNAALSVGPQIFIDRDAIEPANKRWKLEPRKIWYKKKGASVTGVPLEVQNIPNNVAEIMNIVETARRLADDETALPVQAEGELTDAPNITATATNFMSMASNVTFRRVVKSFDDNVTVPNMRRLFDWNMQHNSRADIKGDMKVDARGSSALLLRELQSTMLIAVTQNWSSHPELRLLINLYDTARATLQAMMIPPDTIMPSRQEYEQAVEAQAKAQQEAAQQPDPAVVAANSRLEAAKIDAGSRTDTAMIQREIEMMKLAQQYGIEIDKLKTLLAVEGDKIASKERALVAEAAFEAERMEEAREHGETPKGSGGSL